VQSDRRGSFHGWLDGTITQIQRLTGAVSPTLPAC
jgi:hypothetical protein